MEFADNSLCVQIPSLSATSLLTELLFTPATWMLVCDLAMSVIYALILYCFIALLLLLHSIDLLGKNPTLHMGAVNENCI